MKNEIITIQISEYLNAELAEKIAMAQWHTNDPEWVNRIRQFTFDGKYESDCFHVVALNGTQEVVGRIFCLRNQKETSLWFYGDLFVVPAYRRMGIAKKMVDAMEKAISEKGGKRLRCYVAPDNQPSLSLQNTLGFQEKVYETFDNLYNEGELMFEKTIPSPLRVMPATVQDAAFVCIFYGQNREALHGEVISYDAWKHILSTPQPDEQNFMVYKGVMPVACFRVNGLSGKDTAWLSMLAVCDKFHHQGIGTYAVQYAETLAKDKGFSKLRIPTAADNLPAQGLCQKCGYAPNEAGDAFVKVLV